MYVLLGIFLNNYNKLDDIILNLVFLLYPPNKNNNNNRGGGDDGGGFSKKMSVFIYLST